MLIDDWKCHKSGECFLAINLLSSIAGSTRCQLTSKKNIMSWAGSIGRVLMRLFGRTNKYGRMEH